MNKHCSPIRINPGVKGILKICTSLPYDTEKQNIIKGISEHLTGCSYCRLFFYQETLLQIKEFINPDFVASWALRKCGFEYSQIAQYLDIPLGTVKRQIYEVRNWFNDIQERIGL